VTGSIIEWSPIYLNECDWIPPEERGRIGYTLIIFFPLLVYCTISGGGATRSLPREGAWRNSMETLQLGHVSRSGPEVKNGRSSAKDGAPERRRCGTIQEVSQILQMVSASAARIIFLFYLA